MTIYRQPIPQATHFKYLGIEMTTSGIDWKQTSDPRVTKVKQLANWMSSFGMNINGWRPSSNVYTYLTFLRPMLEYGFCLDLLKLKRNY